MNFQRITNDSPLIVEAESWSDAWPRWMRDSLGAFPKEDRQIDVAVWENEELIGLVSIVPRGDGFETFLRAKRGSALDPLTEAAFQLRAQLFALGAKEIFMWVMARNKPIRFLCNLVGFVQDGLTRLEVGNGKVWEFQRYVGIKAA